MAYGKPRRSVNRPQNMGQNDTVRRRNNARRTGAPFGQGPRAPQAQAQQQQQCPAGQKLIRDPRTGSMMCGPERAAGGAGVPRGNRPAGTNPKRGY